MHDCDPARPWRALNVHIQQLQEPSVLENRNNCKAALVTAIFMLLGKYIGALAATVLTEKRSLAKQAVSILPAHLPTTIPFPFLQVYILFFIPLFHPDHGSDGWKTPLCYEPTGFLLRVVPTAAHHESDPA